MTNKSFKIKNRMLHTSPGSTRDRSYLSRAVFRIVRKWVVVIRQTEFNMVMERSQDDPLLPSAAAMAFARSLEHSYIYIYISTGLIKEVVDTRMTTHM